MLAFTIPQTVTLALTVLSAAAAIAVVALGDTRRNPGQRVVAEKLAQIAVLAAAAAIAALQIQT